MSALITRLQHWLGIGPRIDFASRLDTALADLDPTTLRVEAWERSLPDHASDFESQNDGRNF